MDNQLRLISLFQLDSDRNEFANFMDIVKKAGFKQGSDFWINPGGDASVMFKKDVANSPKLTAARKKFNMSGFGFENAEAGNFIKESTYVVGEKVKVWMGGGKKMLGEIKKIAFGDGFYFVEVAGQTVSRSLHELEPFNEKTDKLVKVAKKTLSLDEAVESALGTGGYFEGKNFPKLEEIKKFFSYYPEELSQREFVDLYVGEFGDRFDEKEVNSGVMDRAMNKAWNAYKNGLIESEETPFNTIDDQDDYLRNRRQIIGREKENMSVDEMVDEAMDMVDTDDEYKFTEDGAPDFGDEESFEHEDENLDEDLEDPSDIDEKKKFMTYLTGETNNFPIGDGQAVLESAKHDYYSKRTKEDIEKREKEKKAKEKKSLKEYEGVEEFVKVKDSTFIKGVAYDSDTDTMYIRFKYGVYEYYDVPEKVFEAFLKAPSMGKFFHQYIRKTYAYSLAKKYKKRGEIRINDEALDVNKTFEPIDPTERHAQMCGKPLEEDHLSSRDEKVKFIIDNAEYMPEDSPLKNMLSDDPEYGQEWLASMDDEEIEQTYLDIEDAKETEGIDYKTTQALKNVQGKDFETENFEEGMDKEVVKEAKSTKRFNILQEDIQTVTNIAKGKGYRVIKVVGELVESKKDGIMNIIVEKNGRKATIVYNDNLNIKPWSWNGTQFNFMQEALDTIYVTKQQILKEGRRVEYKERKDKDKYVGQLLEQRKYADKTTKLSESEAQRREKRSQDILKKFMGTDLINREFDR